MGRKRSNNEGTLYYRESRQEWCAQLSLNGRRLTKYAKTQRECRDWLHTTFEQIRGGLTYEGTQVTLEKFINAWLDGKELSRRPKTVFQYRTLATQHVLPALGKMKLQNIQPAHIRQLYVVKKEDGLGARTLQMVHGLLYGALNQAVKEGIIGRNPVTAVDRPKVERSEMQIFTEEQARQFLIATTGATFEALFYLALTTAMREGEILGLKWADLDWDRCTLHVQRQLQQVENLGYVFSPPKTKAGRRHIKLGDATLGQLTAHRERQQLAKAVAGARWQENDLVFPTTIGTPLDYGRVTKEFKSILKKAGLPDLRFHDLRHTSISLLLEGGTPINTVQQRAGHSKASITTDIYGHSSLRSQNQAADTIEELVVPVAVKLQSK